MFQQMSYEEYLSKTNRKDNRESWIDWETDVCGMSYIEARRASTDPEWGYEKLKFEDLKRGDENKI